jgi:hypothetical protein
MSIGPQNGLTHHEHAAQDMHLKVARCSKNAKKVIDVLKDIVIGTSMHGKGVEKEMIVLARPKQNYTMETPITLKSARIWRKLERRIFLHRVLLNRLDVLL